MSDSHSDIGTYSQSPSPFSDEGSGDSSAGGASTPGAFFFRPRPPRDPRRVRFFGAAADPAPSSDGVCSGSSGDSSPRSASGTWMRGTGIVTATGSRGSGV